MTTKTAGFAHLGTLSLFVFHLLTLELHWNNLGWHLLFTVNKDQTTTLDLHFEKN